ncbi:MAG: LapA family protein [Pyrinomonadaceae bacterium]
MRKLNAKQPVDTATRVKTYLLIAMCMLLFVAGLFFAGRQHFSSMDYGMKNSRLRKQVDELESEKRRLLLARETSMSPTEIKKAAKRVGLFGTENAEQTVAQVTSTTKAKATPTVGESNPVITKTAAVAPVAKVETASFQKNAKTSVPAKKVSVEKRTPAAE